MKYYYTVSLDTLNVQANTIGPFGRRLVLYPNVDLLKDIMGSVLEMSGCGGYRIVEVKCNPDVVDRANFCWYDLQKGSVVVCDIVETVLYEMETDVCDV